MAANTDETQNRGSNTLLQIRVLQELSIEGLLLAYAATSRVGTTCNNNVLIPQSEVGP
jgi:hypothetical protein